jgi:cystathionine beta-lyase/cystathionine gamma-synthase
MDLSYILNRLGEEDGPSGRPVAPPLAQTSNFAFRTAEDLRAALADEYRHTLYSRGNNPTVDLLRQKLAALDGAEDALVTASGAAAVFLAVFANVKSGDHCVCVQDPYSWTHKLFTDLLPRFGVTATMADGRRPEHIEKALRPETRLVFLESPNTLTFDLQDLAAVATLAKRKGLLTVVDNSYCTPLNQRPLDLGIDLAVQTATKYLGGHSDALAGVIAGRRQLIEKIFVADFLNTGAAVSPFNAWLILRSLRTLELRVRRSGESALQLARRLEGHPKIERVRYPFLGSFPQAALAKTQMKGPGGMFTLSLKTDSAEPIEKFCRTLKRFLLAVSWGGHESLVFPVVATKPVKEFDPANERHRMVRFYIGLEEPEVLLKDILTGLNEM